MPVYLLHGFRWPRSLVRIHIILQNLDDAAAEWLVAPATTNALLNNFNEIYPDCMEHLQQLRFVEQYDPNDTSPDARSQPYAYVADVCEEIQLGIDVDEVRGKGLPNDQWAMMMELRDKLAPEEKVAWYVVVCGDEDRWAPGLSGSSTSNQEESSAGLVSRDGSEEDNGSDVRGSMGQEDETRVDSAEAQSDPQIQHTQQPKGLKKLFSALGKRKSQKDLSSNNKSVESLPVTLRENGGPPTTSSSEDRQLVSEDPHKYAVPKSLNPTSSSDKALLSSVGSGADRGSQSQLDKIARRISMPKLLTKDLSFKSSDRALNGRDSAIHSPGSLDMAPDDVHDVITGPRDEDDSHAAPAPVVRHGKQQDLIARQRKRTSIPSFTSGVRGTSPETLRNISPLVRVHPQSFSPNVTRSSAELAAQYTQYEHQPHQLQREVLPDEIEEPTARSMEYSQPASYVPTGAPLNGFGSLHTSRSSSPAKIASRQRSNSRISALNHSEGNGYDSSEPLPIRGARSRPSSVQTNSALNPRQSQYSMNSMSGTMSTSFGGQERSTKQSRQSVTQDDLLAKGLDSMDFTALR